MQKVLSFHRVVGTLSGLLVMVLMFLILIDVIGRKFFNQPLLGAVEVSTLILSWILFVPLAYALVQGIHVRVTMVLGRLSPRRRLVAEVIIAALCLTFFVMAVYAGWNGFWISFSARENMAAPFWIPLWLAKMALPIGCFLMAMQLAIGLVNYIRQLGRRV